MSFFSEFFGICDGVKETAVCCPFPHYTSSGIPYLEANPSASVNTLDSKNCVFHCMRCGAGYSELQFIEQYFGCSLIQAKKLLRAFNSHEDVAQWQNDTTLTKETKEKALALGYSEEVINLLKLATKPGGEQLICYPVFMYGHLLDIRIYNPDKKPKIKSRANAPSGLIIPFDTWKDSNKITVICAGEKDMAIARTKGFNAITITGGEQSLPICPKLFTDKKVVICYDNDDAGITGANKLATCLYQYTKEIKVCTNFHEICANKGEDIYDFFTKYDKSKNDLIEYFNKTPNFEPSEESKYVSYPVMNLASATNPKYVNKLVRSNIQVVAVSDQSFLCPSELILEKYKISGNNDTMMKGDFKDWQLSDDNVENILHMMDSNFKEENILKNLKTLKRIPNERCVRLKVLKNVTVYKCFVTDMFETTEKDAQPMEFMAYSVGCKLDSGKKYQVTYKLTPHPYKGQQLTMLITNAVQANDSVSDFALSEETIDKLNYFRYLPGNVERKMDKLTEKVKGIIGYNGNETLIQTIDLGFNTPLQFNFGNYKNIRGYLDILLVSESRVGKSSTADALRKTYQLGTITSLAGNAATIPGLVGGSNKTANGYQTRAGIIPQNHRGLIIFEEFGKSNHTVITELTDIRSSNEVRITRVAGTITLPAMVRMISLTNPKTQPNGAVKSIASYPNGITLITELVNAAEDIARYDLITIIADKGNTNIDPFWQPEEPFPEEAYQARIRWIWSRTPEQIIIDKEVCLYILEVANALNKLYSCHIKIFGTEAWKKLTRLSVAIAGYIVSTDDTYENIIVTKEIVDYAFSFFVRIYDNDTFKLREYVENERRYTTVDKDSIDALQNFYMKHASIVRTLEQYASTTKSVLASGSGLNNDDLSKALNILSTKYFIRFHGNEIIPTERFRLALAKINRDTDVPELGTLINDDEDCPF